jgi:hypothetical protein
MTRIFFTSLVLVLKGFRIEAHEVGKKSVWEFRVRPLCSPSFHYPVRRRIEGHLYRGWNYAYL